MRRTTSPRLSDLELLALEIAVPLTLANLVAVLGMVGWFSATRLLQWLSIACSVWVLLVLQFGPMLAPARKETGKE